MVVVVSCLAFPALRVTTSRTRFRSSRLGALSKPLSSFMTVTHSALPIASSSFITCMGAGLVPLARPVRNAGSHSARHAPNYALRAVRVAARVHPMPPNTSLERTREE